MISAVEALSLPSARITEEDIELYKSALAKINAYVNEKMKFAGPEGTLEMPEDQMNFTAGKMLAVTLKRLGWNMNLQFGQKQTNFGISSVWLMFFSPTIEVYEQFLADFDIAAPAKQLLV